jgi:putative transcriptional regulator
MSHRPSIDESTMKSLQGQLLIASPRLRDPNFRHSVVLMIQHNDDGALGVILNRPLSATIQEIWSKVSDKPCASQEPLRFGGPCEGPLMAIHTRQTLSESEIIPGVFLGVEPAKLARLVAKAGNKVRFFAGYAGWAAGQLEHEMDEGSWLTVPAQEQHIFYDVADLWKQLTSDIGASTLFSALKIKHVPDDPSVN